MSKAFQGPRTKRPSVISIALWRPPYRKADEWPAAPPDRLPTGSIAVMRIVEDEALDGPSGIPQFLRSFMRFYPAVPVALELPTTPRGEWLRSLPGVRVGRDGREARILLRGPAESSVLRAAATELLEDAVSHWLHVHRPPATAAQEGMISCLSSFLTRGRTPLGTEWASASTLKKMGLPTPHRWKMLREALPTAMYLQREGVTVARAAYATGYCEPRAFRRHCTELFDLAPSTVAMYAGWELLLHRFIEAA